MQRRFGVSAIVLISAMVSLASRADETFPFAPNRSATALSTTAEATSPFSAEIPVGSLTYAGAFGSQGRPQTASSGNGFLTVWEDSRSAPSFIYGARSDSSGRLLDPTNFRVGAGTSPVVVWTGDHYLVGYLTECLTLAFQSVASNGELLGNPSTIATGSSGCVARLHLAWNGQFATALWPQSSGLYAVIVGPNGRVVSSLIQLNNSTTILSEDLVSDGSSFFSVMLDAPGGTRGITGIWTNSAGTIQKTKALFRPGNATGVAVGYNGIRYLVAWPGAGGTGAVAAFVDSGGITTPAFPIANGDPQSTFGSLRVASAQPGAPASVAVAYVRARVDGTAAEEVVIGVDLIGGTRDLAHIPVAPSAATMPSAALAWRGSDFYSAWPGATPDGIDIFGAVVSGSQAVTNPSATLLSISSASQGDPAIATNGYQLYVAWREYVPGVGFAIKGQRLAGNGSPIAGTEMVLSTATDNAAPLVAFDGTNYVVVWQQHGSTLFVRRVGADGIPLDPAAVVLTTTAVASLHPAVAAARGATLVTWNEFSSSLLRDTDLFGQVIASGDSTILNSRFAIATSSENERESAAASDGTQFLVAWRQSAAVDQSVYPPPRDLPPVSWRGARVTAAGAVLDVGGFEIAPPSADQGNASIAWDGKRFLTVWTESHRLSGRFIGADGQPQSQPILIVALTSNVVPTVLATGSSYQVLWNNPVDATHGMVMVQPILASGQGMDLLIASSGEQEIAEAGGTVLRNGTSVLVYPRVGVESVYGGVSRIFIRLNGPVPFPGRPRAARH
jgi:hypothetical protein